MNYKKFDDYYIVRIDRGEEIVENLKTLAKTENILLGTISGIGACDDVTLGVYSVEEQKYYENKYHEELELTSLNGNLSVMQGETYLHLHANFGRANGEVVGGHLNKAVISGTSEIFIHTINAQTDRKKDPETGLNIFDFDE